MTDYLLLFVGTVLVNNFVLVKFLGLCPFMGFQKLETAMGMGLATTFVMTLASVCAWWIDTDPHPAGVNLSPHAGFYPRLSRLLCNLPKWWCAKPALRCIACWASFCR